MEEDIAFDSHKHYTRVEHEEVATGRGAAVSFAAWAWSDPQGFGGLFPPAVSKHSATLGR